MMDTGLYTQELTLGGAAFFDEGVVGYWKWRHFAAIWSTPLALASYAERFTIAVETSCDFQLPVTLSVDACKFIRCISTQLSFWLGSAF